MVFLDFIVHLARENKMLDPRDPYYVGDFPSEEDDDPDEVPEEYDD